MSKANDNDTFVRFVQRWLGMIKEDGWAGEKTRAAFAAETGYHEPEDATPDTSILPGFRGDLAWVHAWEPHQGRPFWPKGASGVTLDPGVDLGHADPELIDEAYAGMFSTAQFSAMVGVYGIRGKAAEHALDADPVLQSIRITEADAAEIFPLVARPYWVDVVERFPDLIDRTPPPEVHTAMLSLAYNRGANNRHLDVISEAISEGSWKAVGQTIAGMQQDHELKGIRRRRREEGALILAAVA